MKDKYRLVRSILVDAPRINVFQTLEIRVCEKCVNTSPAVGIGHTYFFCFSVVCSIRFFLLAVIHCWLFENTINTNIHFHFYVSLIRSHSLDCVVFVVFIECMRVKLHSFLTLWLAVSLWISKWPHTHSVPYSGIGSSTLFFFYSFLSRTKCTYIIIFIIFFCLRSWVVQK